MANRSYLIVSNNDAIFPRLTEPNFDSNVQVIAQGIYCVPLLWFGLFRSKDLRTQESQEDSRRWTKLAPIIDVRTAVIQMEQAVPLFDQMFPGGNFAEYGKFLIRAIRSAGRKNVTIEMEEIADLAGPDELYNDCRVALGMFSGEESIADGKEKLITISEIDEELDIPPARCLVEDDSVSDEAAETHSRIIGVSFLQSVPWEDNT